MTLEEVAKVAGVSRATVSRVINDEPNVRSEVRSHVWEVIKACNYQPHEAARSLVTRRTNAIGLIVPETVSRLFSDPFFPHLIQGISQICNERGYYLMLTLMDMVDRESVYRRLLYGNQLDGVIISSASLDDPIMPHLRRSGRPCVLVGQHPGYPDLSCVDVDNVDGARQMVEFLLSLGHRRIAAITGPLSTMVGQDRLAGYRQALREAGVGQDEALVVEGDFTEMSGYLAVERLLAHEPSAIFAASDVMAAGALKALLRAGRRVPDDVSLAGFDDAPIAALMQPPLTTVRQPMVDLGRTATEMLLARIDEPDAPVRMNKLSTTLISRASTRRI